MKYPKLAIGDIGSMVNIFHQTKSSTVAIIGNPGSGKTEASTYQLKALGYKVHRTTADTLVSSIDTALNMDKAISHTFVDQNFLKWITEPEGKTVVIIDEFMQALGSNISDDMQVIVRNLLHERQIGNNVNVHPDVSFLLLGNSGEHLVSGLMPHELMQDYLLSNLVIYEVQLPKITQWFRECREGWGKDIKWHYNLEILIKSVWVKFPDEIVTPRSIVQLNEVLGSLQKYPEQSRIYMGELVVEAKFQEFSGAIIGSLITAMRDGVIEKIEKSNKEITDALHAAKTTDDVLVIMGSINDPSELIEYLSNNARAMPVFEKDKVAKYVGSVIGLEADALEHWVHVTTKTAKAALDTNLEVE